MRHALLAILVVTAASCAPEGSTVIGGVPARATIVAAPFSIVVDDGAGNVLTRLRGIAKKEDAFIDEAELLPGWDGYIEGPGDYTPLGDATILDSSDESATLAFADGSVVVVAVDGGRVRLSFALAEGSEFDGAPTKTSLVFELNDDNDLDGGDGDADREAFFGLGERFASLNHRGQSLYSYAEEGGLGGGEALEGNAGAPFPNGPSMTYFPVPFFISSAGYGLHLDTTLRSELHLGSESETRWRAAVDGPAFDVVVYAGKPLAVLDAYTEDTGRPMIPAQWVFGPRRRVSVGQRVDGVDEWRLLRERDVPTTGIDDAMHFLPHSAHAGREDELRAWTTELHRYGFKVMAYNNPYVSSSIDTGRADFEFGRDNGFFLLDDLGQPGETFFISGAAQTLATIDLTNRDAVLWFQDLLRRTLDLGYDGWMHDFGEYVERSWTASNGMRGDELHNLFPVLSAQAAHELLEAERPDDYLFFVRSGYSGTQAFVPAVWGGDAEASFDETQGIPSALRSGLSLSMSGVPYWGSDTTGFKCLSSSPQERDKEMYLRWAQLSAVSPIMMEQNACSNPLEETDKWTLWSDDETTENYGDMARLHTRLQPYFLQLAVEANATGAPLMRHPFLAFPNDPRARAVDSAFFVGDALFAAPVIRRGETVKRTYLPKGRYVDLDDGKLYEGFTDVDIPAPLTKLPLLLAEARLLPLLDASIDTLAPAEPDDTLDIDVVTLDDVADRLDVLVLLAPDGGARTTLVDGTELEVSATDDDDSAGGAVDVFGDVARVSAFGRDSFTFGGWRFTCSNPALNVTWTVYELPAQ